MLNSCFCSADRSTACTISTAGYVKDLTDKLADLTDEISEIITDEDTLLLENEGKLKATARRAYEAFKENAATSGASINHTLHSPYTPYPTYYRLYDGGGGGGGGGSKEG